jgi:hypothetical protein
MLHPDIHVWGFLSQAQISVSPISLVIARFRNELTVAHLVSIDQFSFEGAEKWVAIMPHKILLLAWPILGACKHFR